MAKKSCLTVKSKQNEDAKKKSRVELEECVREFCQEDGGFEEDTELVDLLLTDF